MGNRIRLVLLVALTWLGGFVGHHLGSLPLAYPLSLAIGWGVFVACILGVTYKFFPSDSGQRQASDRTDTIDTPE